MKEIDQSLKVKDYNMALIASMKMLYTTTKAEGLSKVVAADKMPYVTSKKDALDKVVNAYAVFSNEPEQSLVSHSSE